MLWTGLGLLRFSVTGVALATVGFDFDWLWLRLAVVAAGLLILALMSRKMRAEREYRALLTRTLAQALRQPPGAVPVPVPRRAR